MSLNRKLATSFLLIALIMDMALAALFSKMNHLTRLMEEVETVSLREEKHTREMQTAILQVQQWLTDISATRGAAGYDDGFDKAAEQARLFRRHLASLRHLYQKTGDGESANRLDRLGEKFEVFYVLGKKMAQAYVGGGPVAGNALMGQFDPQAEQLFEALEVQRQASARHLAAEFARVHQNAALARGLAVASLILPLVLFFATGYWLTSSIAKPLGRVAHVLEAMAQGDLTKRV